MGSASKHQCLIYEGSPSEHLESLASIIIEKLRDNHRCLYLHSPTIVALMRARLERAGLDVEKEIQKGALILSSEQNHLDNGEFDGPRMINLLRRAVDQAQFDGYKALWASGDMAWELGGKIDLDTLFDYEYALEALFKEGAALSGICQYHRDTMPAAALRVALVAHKDVWVNQTLVTDNRRYGNVEGMRAAEPVDGDLLEFVSATAE